MHGAQQPEGDPGLATKFRCVPARSVGDKREGRRQHQYPQHPACREEPAPPEQKRRQTHNGEKDRAQADHDVIAIVGHIDGVGALIRREVVEALDDCLPAPVGQEAQDVGHDNGVIDGAGVRVRLADDHNARPTFRMEQALHRGQFGRLISSDLLPLQIAAGVELEDAG